MDNDIFDIFDDGHASKCFRIDSNQQMFELFIANHRWKFGVAKKGISISRLKSDQGSTIVAELRIRALYESKEPSVWLKYQVKFDKKEKIGDMMPWFDLETKYIIYEGDMDWNTMEVEYTIQTIDGIKYTYDDYQQYMTGTQVIFRSSDKLIRVYKEYLCMYSQFFRGLFYSNFNEKDQEIIDTSIPFDDFRDLLHIIYPCRKPISLHTYSRMMTIADGLIIPKLTEICENFFQKQTKACQLLYAEVRELEDLYQSVLASIVDISDLQTVHYAMVDQKVLSKRIFRDIFSMRKKLSEEGEERDNEMIRALLVKYDV